MRQYEKGPPGFCTENLNCLQELMNYTFYSVKHFMGEI